MFKNLLSSKRKIFLLLTCMLLSLGLHAQVRITGRVTSSDDQSPIPGASIKIKNSAQGTMTDGNGAFAISASPSDVLVISFVGYQSSEVTVGSRTTVNVALKQEDNNLNEIVVTGYTSQRKKDLTGAVSVVDMAQLKSQPAASAVESLQGKAPGVQIVVDGAPGSTPQIRVRGVTTINNNDPLYEVDGVPYQG